MFPVAVGMFKVYRCAWKVRSVIVAPSMDKFHYEKTCSMDVWTLIRTPTEFCMKTIHFLRCWEDFINVLFEFVYILCCTADTSFMRSFLQQKALRLCWNPLIYMEAALKWFLPSNPISYVAPAGTNHFRSFVFCVVKQNRRWSTIFWRSTLKKGIFVVGFAFLTL